MGTMSTEQIAGMSMEEISAMAISEAQEVAGEDDVLPGEGDIEVKTGEQVVEENAATGETEETGNIEMKSGKGTIPYAVLKDTREELAETKRRLEALESQSYKSVVPENHAELTAQAQSGYQDLAKKYEDGELEWEEYQAKLIELSVQNQALLSATIKAEISTEMQAQAAEQAAKQAQESWDKACDTFLASKADGIDYIADAAKMAELDAAVKMFASNPANMRRDNAWFLARAHREVIENNGIMPKQIPKKDIINSADKGSPVSPILSLSDIPGGFSAADSGRVLPDSTAALTELFLKDPGKIDAYLASIT